MGRSKRVLFFSPEFPPFPGGAGRFAFGLATGVAAQGMAVSVLTARVDRSREVSHDAGQPINVIRRPLGTSTLTQYPLGAVWLQAEVLKQRPAAIIVTDLLAHRIVCLGTSLGSSRLIVLSHGTDSEINFNEGTCKRLLFTRLYSKADRIIANSRYTAGLLEARGIERRKIDVVLPGIDVSLFSRPADPARIRRRYGLDSKQVLLTVGSLSARKGHRLVLAALPAILKRAPETVYLVVGEGEMRPELEREIEQRGLSRNVILAGACTDDELPHYYDACDVFLLPNTQQGSLVEGFGIVYLEASARGKPVIGCRNAGVPEAVVDGVTGCLIDRFDAGLLADAVLGLLTDRARAGRLGEAGRRRSLAEFGYDRLGRQLAECLKSSLGDSPNQA